mmetsp:Transcript_1241/g.1893  ORF Transcript_1241/g.1893 Transcript_1241/m.1893 type:complete len:101 (-) Transcript_1241:373-675(-)
MRGGAYDSSFCEWDGGDCSAISDLSVRRPDYVVEDPALLGNGRCDGGYNTLGRRRLRLMEKILCQGEYKHCRAHEAYRVGDGVCDVTERALSKLNPKQNR